MWNINYKNIKNIVSNSKLRKFDTGYQRGDNFGLSNSGINRPATNIAESFIPEALGQAASGILQSVPNIKGTLGSITKKIPLSTINQQPVSLDWVDNDITKGLKPMETPSQSGTGTSGTTNALGSAAKFASIAESAKGAFDMYRLMTDRNVPGGDELLQSAARQQENVGGVLYDTYSGLPDLSKYKSDLKTASGIKGAVAANNLVAAPADLLAPVTGGLSELIRPAAAIVGFLAGGLRGRHQAKEIAKREEWARQGITGYNRQSESNAATKAIQNEFYSADKGLNLFDSGKPNGLMGPLESFIQTKNVNGQTRVDFAETAPETNYARWREDKYPIRTNGDTAILGNKVDERTGIPFSFEAIPAVQQFNSGNPYEKATGEIALLDLIDQQRKTKDNRYLLDDVSNIRLADKGKNTNNMKKYDPGKPNRYTGFDALRDSKWLNLLPAVMSSLGSYNLYKQAKNMPFYRPNVYAQSNGDSIVNRMSTKVNINPLLRTINDQTRYGQYAIRNLLPGYTSGQRLGGLTALYNNALNSYADIYAKKWDAEQQKLANKIAATLDVDEKNTARMFSANQYNDTRTAEASGRRYNAMAKYYTGPFEALAKYAENANNNNWMLALNNLYEQELTGDQEDTLNNMGKSNGLKNGFKFTPINWTPNTDLNYRKIFPQWNMFNNRVG